MKALRRARRRLYRAAALLGDAEALGSGSPRRMARRAANKRLGRKLSRWLWR